MGLCSRVCSWLSIYIYIYIHIYLYIYTPFGAEGLRDIEGWSGWGWGGDDNIPGGGGVGMMTFLARAHMGDATQLAGRGWGGDDDIPCTCANVRCYVTDGGGVGMMTFLALTHM